MMRLIPIFLLSLSLLGCSTSQDGTPCHPKFAGRAYNRPYQIKGQWYHPQGHYEYSEQAMASYYGGTDVFHGRKTSNGEVFDMNRLSAAHKTLPIPCIVRVTNLKNGRSIRLKINDRGPFVENRIIDVSRKAAQLLGFYRDGVAPVHVETCMEESLALASGELVHLDGESVAVKIPQTKPQKKKIKAPTIKPHPQTLIKNGHLITWEGNFFIQSGKAQPLTTARTTATTLMSRIPKVGVRLDPVGGKKINGQKYYRVLLGPIRSRQSAQNLLNLME